MILQHEIIIFLSLLIFLIGLGFYLINQYKVNNVEKFRLAITYLGAFSVALITYNIFISIRTDYWNEQNRIAYNTIDNIQKNFLEPQKGLLKAYPEGYALYASMNPDSELPSYQPKNIDPVKRLQVELYYSLRIFQSMEDLISTASYDITGIPCWLNTFLQWMQSPLLQHYWALVDYHFTPRVKTLVTALIQESNKLAALRETKGSLTAEDYNKVSHNFPLDVLSLT